MKPFSYYRATDVATAATELDQHREAKVIAGGTNLLDLIKEDVAQPNELVDITRLPLAEITELDDGGLRLGALATNAETAKHPLVLARYPLLSQAILAGASPQLRNMATDGGNLLQRTRCVYFYDTKTPCNKREPGSGCSAIPGYNRNHAILGTSDHCIATHPSDMCVALAALEAVIQLQGPAGNRSIPFADFHRLPGDLPEQDSIIEPNEIITAIDLPPQGFSENHHYLKIRDRHSYAFALVSVAAALQIQDGLIADARIALGGVAHKPWRDTDAEQTLAGNPPSREVFAKAADLILRDAKGYPFNTFKIELARGAIVRALMEAAQLPFDS
jgi:xanthine dehydrogenase YagS FAD-binding subunit